MMYDAVCSMWLPLQEAGYIKQRKRGFLFFLLHKQHAFKISSISGSSPASLSCSHEHIPHNDIRKMYICHKYYVH